MDLGQDALDLLEIGPAAAVEVDAAPPALEERGAEMALQGADAVADRGGGDAELLAGQHEALVPGGGLDGGGGESSLPASTKLWWRAAASKKRRLSSGGRWSTATVRTKPFEKT